MNDEFWKQQLRYFIVRYSAFEETEEEIFTPRENLKIRFWIEGNLQIEGAYKELEINYNSPEMLILSTRKKNSSQSNIFRIPWARLITFELITNEDTDDELRKLVRFSPERLN